MMKEARDNTKGRVVVKVEIGMMVEGQIALQVLKRTFVNLRFRHNFSVILDAFYGHANGYDTR